MADLGAEVTRYRVEIRNIHSQLATGILSERARKARRIVMLFSVAGIIWCKGVIVRKASLGGFEVEGLIELIPLILVSFIAFFGLQFYVYMFVDRIRAKYLFRELARLSKLLGVIHKRAKKQNLHSDFIEDIDGIRKDTKRMINMKNFQLYWDFTIVSVLLVATGTMFVGNYFIGWFGETSVAP